MSIKFTVEPILYPATCDICGKKASALVHVVTLCNDCLKETHAEIDKMLNQYGVCHD